MPRWPTPYYDPADGSWRGLLERLGTEAAVGT